MIRILSVLLMWYASMAFAQEKVTIHGYLKNLEGHQVVIHSVKNGVAIRDTFTAQNGLFQATLSIDEMQEIMVSPHRYYKNAILPKGKKSYLGAPKLSFLVVPGDQLSINGDAMRMWECTVEGGAYTRDFSLFQTRYAPLQTKRWDMAYRRQKLLNADRTEEAKEVQGMLHDLGREEATMLKKFYTGDTTNIYAVFYLSKNKGHVQPAELERIYSSYTTTLQHSVFGKQIEESIERNRLLGVGNQIPDFVALSLDGSQLDSKSLRGKYVLLDFWGSWCGPCRNNHPHLSKLYVQYKDQGFEILGIAQERSENKEQSWKKAIQEDGIHWLHVLNVARPGDTDLLKLYNVGALPTKILIDKEGKVLWKGIGAASQGLDQKLEEIFN